MKFPPSIQGALIDLDGTLYLGDELIPGADAFLSRLRGQGRRILFLSNNSSCSRLAYRDKLRRLGVDAELEEVFTSTTATILYLKRHRPTARVFPLGTPEFVHELRQAGIILDDVDPNLLLLAFDKTLDYAKITRAYQLLVAGADYVATHPDVLCPTADGFIPDTGSFIALFREATGREPVIIGKPSAEMIASALAALDLGPDETAMIGDRLYTDMKMALDGGLLSVLVLSGETCQADLEGLDVHPDIVVDSVADLE